jgi:predicted PurR-regulated permease PerM
MSKQPIEVTVSNRTVIRVIALIIATIFLLRFIENVGHALELIFLSFFLSLALNPVVSWIRRNLHLKSRVTATAIAYLTVIIILGSIIALVVPPLVRQTVDFVSEVPHTVRSLMD